MPDERWSNKEWVRSKIVSEMTDSQSYKSERMELWESIDRAYRGRHKYYYKNRSNLFVPVTFWSVENIAPRWAGVDQRVIYLPQNDTSFMQHAPAMTRFWDFQWRKCGPGGLSGQLTLIDLIKITLKYGLGVYRVYWHKDVRNTYRWYQPTIQTPYGEMPIPGMKIPGPAQMVHHNGPKGEAIVPWLFFWDPNAVDIDGANWVSYARLERLGDLKADGLYNLENFKGLGPDTTLWLLEYWRDDRLVAMADVKDADKYTGGDTGAQDIEQANEWGENWQVIRNEHNPHWYGRKPFIKITDYPVERKFWGLSTCEVLESLQAEVNAIRNLRMDASLLNLMPVTLVGARANVENFQRYPGAVIPVMDTKEIEELKTGDLKNAGVHEVNELMRDIQKTIGSNEAVEGGNIQTSRTPATTLQQVDQLGTVRIAFKSMILAHSFFTKLSTWHRQLNRQHLPEKQAFAIGGYAARKWLEIPPEVWEQEWDCYPVVVSADSHTPQAKTAQILGFVNSIGPIIQYAQGMQALGVNPRELIEQIVKHYQGIFENPLEIMQQLQQHMMEPEMQPGMQQAAAPQQPQPLQGQAVQGV